MRTEFGRRQLPKCSDGEEEGGDGDNEGRRKKVEGWQAGEEAIRATRRPRQCEQKEEKLEEPPGSRLNRGGLDRRLLWLSARKNTKHPALICRWFKLSAPLAASPRWEKGAVLKAAAGSGSPRTEPDVGAVPSGRQQRRMKGIKDRF